VLHAHILSPQPLPIISACALRSPTESMARVAGSSASTSMSSARAHLLNTGICFKIKSCANKKRMRMVTLSIGAQSSMYTGSEYGIYQKAVSVREDTILDALTRFKRNEKKEFDGIKR
jgi:hypothetical protein